MMIDDDDPKTPEPASQTGAQADDQDDAAAPEGDEPEGDDDAETKASTDDEDAGDEDDEQDDEGDDDEDGDKPKRVSRNQRYKRRAEKAEAENAELRSRQSGSLPSDQASIQRAFEYEVWREIGDPPDPNDPRFRNADGSPNYARFEREAQGWENDRRAVSRQVRKDMVDRAARESDRVGELVADHKERVSRLRGKVKDFDAIMQRATLPVAPHVERLILESKRSDRISLYLAKDQSKLAKLNNMSSEAVARELGRIEGRLSSLPQAKQQTRARPPIKPLRGGGGSPPSGLAAVNAYIKKQYGSRG